MQGALDANLIGCHCCGKLQTLPQIQCSRCGSLLHARKTNSLHRSWAWLLTAMVFYVPANILPVMYTNQLGQQAAATILGGIVLLWQDGSEPIAAIIFIASVLVPVAKLIALFWLCFSVQIASSALRQERSRVYRVVEFVGRWSMIDVFVVAILASLIQMGNLMSVSPGPAALPFAIMVVLTMFAAHSFDTRLIWDDHD